MLQFIGTAIAERDLVEFDEKPTKSVEAKQNNILFDFVSDS